MNAPAKTTKAQSKKVTDYSPTAMRMTWAHASRDIVITALNNGQIITLALLGFLGMIIYKFDKTDIKEIIRMSGVFLRDNSFIGYGLFAICLLVSLIFVKFLTFTHAKILKEKQNIIDSLLKKQS